MYNKLLLLHIDIDLNWTLKETIEKIKEWEGINKNPENKKEEWRLRNLEKKTLYIREELGEKLEHLNFQEGGTRLQIEKGVIPGLSEVAVTIKEFKTEVTANLSLKEDTTIGEL